MSTNGQSIEGGVRHQLQKPNLRILKVILTTDGQLPSKTAVKNLILVISLY